MLLFPMTGLFDAQKTERMTTKPPFQMPNDLAGAANLMAHPMAGAAAFSALGFGFAGHAFGIWMGAAAGAVEASNKFFANAFEDASEPEEKKPAETASAKAKSAARAVIDDAQAVARKAAHLTLVPSTRAKEAKRVSARKPKSIERPSAPDDLKQIEGIGPKLEQVLNGLGIWTYAQIAGWKAQEIDWVEDHLSFKGRIARDGWLDQAKNLVAKINY
jgi:NADH-quinone oxidoreductase subunit E